MSELVRFSMQGRVAVIQMDDGKANALSHDMLDGLNGAFDRAETDEAGAIMLAGRPGRFSAGFDLSVMRAGDGDAVRDLVNKGAQLALRLFESPMPVVLGVNGHALAMGAVLCLAADIRIGSRGDYKIGLNEVAIGMALPPFALILAEDRISRRHLTRATANAEIYSPERAVDVGYLDWVVEDGETESAAIEYAEGLASGLHAKAHQLTKEAVRGSALDRLRAASGVAPKG